MLTSFCFHVNDTVTFYWLSVLLFSISSWAQEASSHNTSCTVAAYQIHETCSWEVRRLSQQMANSQKLIYPGEILIPRFFLKPDISRFLDYFGLFDTFFVAKSPLGHSPKFNKSLQKKMLLFLFRFKANFLEKMCGYHYFPLCIPIALVKNYLFHMVLTFVFRRHHP